MDVVINPRNDQPNVVLINLLKHYDRFVDSLVSHNAPQVILMRSHHHRTSYPFSIACQT